MNFLLTTSPIPYLPVWLDREADLFVIVDLIDYNWMSEWMWYKKKSQRTAGHRVKWYAYRTGRQCGVRVSLYLHVLITARAWGPRPSTRHVSDHRNGQSLDCRRDNLHWATRKQNRANIK